MRNAEAILAELDALRDRRQSKTVSEDEYHADWDRLWAELRSVDLAAREEVARKLAEEAASRRAEEMARRQAEEVVRQAAEEAAARRAGLKFANRHGNYELLGNGVPNGYVHVKGKGLSAVCTRLKIRFVRAVVGFRGQRKYGYSPKFDGVIVTKAGAVKLCQALAERPVKKQWRALLVSAGFDPGTALTPDNAKVLYDYLIDQGALPETLDYLRVYATCGQGK